MCPPLNTQNRILQTLVEIIGLHTYVGSVYGILKEVLIHSLKRQHTGRIVNPKSDSTLKGFGMSFSNFCKQEQRLKRGSIIVNSFPHLAKLLGHFKIICRSLVPRYKGASGLWPFSALLSGRTGTVTPQRNVVWVPTNITSQIEWTTFLHRPKGGPLREAFLCTVSVATALQNQRHLQATGSTNQCNPSLKQKCKFLER